jgi:thiol-disulfide isomerase/thioredoxin
MHAGRLIAVLSVVVLAVACPGGGQGDVRRSAPALIAEGADGVELLPEDRFALPTLSFDQFQSLLGDLADQGVPVLVNIWGSWCGPCRTEAPHLRDAAERFGRQVQFLGVDIKDLRSPARDFIEEFRWPYPSLFDPQEQIKTGLGYLGQPDTVIYNATRQKVFEMSGPTDRDDLFAALEEVTR